MGCRCRVTWSSRQPRSMYSSIAFFSSSKTVLPNEITISTIIIVLSSVRVWPLSIWSGHRD